MNAQIQYAMSLPHTDVPEKLKGLSSMRKVQEPNGAYAFLSSSKLDLDTDGVNDPAIQHWDADHQSQTSLKGLDANKHPYIVLPGGFTKRHDGIPLGTSCTVMYGSKRIHALYGDIGPRTKFGEASIAVHRGLGFERVKNGRILNVGIDTEVYILLYLDSVVPNPLDLTSIEQTGHDNFVKFWKNAGLSVEDLGQSL